MTSDIKKVTAKLLKFRKERNWKQFHNPKDLALSVVLEASELLEHFQWKNGTDIDAYIKKHKKEIGEELADVFNWLLLFSHDLDIDILNVAEKKIAKNAKRYPVRKAKGKALKYNKL